MSDQRLDLVLQRAWGHFTPEHPSRRPWRQGRVSYGLAYTGNVAVVPLRIADRVQLRGLDRARYDRDDLEPTDWMPVGWATAPA